MLFALPAGKVDGMISLKSVAAFFGFGPRANPLPAPVAAAAPAPIKHTEIDLGEAEAGTLVVEFEGEQLSAYQDIAGNWAQGFGSSRDIDGNPVCASTPPITHAQAVQMMQRDIKTAALDAADAVKVQLTKDEWAAIFDFTYNLGIGKFRSSTLLADLNAGNFAAAAAQFDQWDHAGGRIVAGLLRRRQAETALFETKVT